MILTARNVGIWLQCEETMFYYFLKKIVLLAIFVEGRNNVIRNTAVV